MDRARAAILTGARLVVAESGVRHLTMSAVAERGGVAKATIYNHFRGRGELLDALLVDELTDLAAIASSGGDELVDQLAAVGRALNVNPVLDGLRRHEPEVLAAMASAAARPGRDSRADAVRSAVVHRLVLFGDDTSAASVDLVIRWLCSLAWAPLADDLMDAQAHHVAQAVTRSLEPVL
jgi:AcrR family transcriptional regulator